MELEKEIDQKQFASEYDKLAINLVYTANWLAYRQARLFKTYDITAQQYNILRILRGCAPRPAKVQYLTERMLDKSSNASRLIDKLEEKKLASRRVCPGNRRAVDVSITPEGLELLAKLDPLMKGFGQECSQVACSEEVATINAFLDKLRDIDGPPALPSPMEAGSDCGGQAALQTTQGEAVMRKASAANV